MHRHSLINHFVKVLDKVAPLALADHSWDNVGLLLESPTVKLADDKTCRVLLTIDLTEPVYKEAIEKKVGIILSYHPPWFRGEKSLTLDQSRGLMRTVTLCAASGISIYSPHSALDSISENGCGLGRIVTLVEPTPLNVLAKRWCDYTAIPYLRMALPSGKSETTPISTIAICVGSGSSILTGLKADLYFTGEMSHHDILKATIAYNAAVILTEHTNCERGYLKDVLAPRLTRELNSDDYKFEILVSDVDCDPIKIINLSQ